MEKERRPVNLREGPSPVSRKYGEKFAARVNQLKDIYLASNKVRLREVEAHSRDATAIAYRGEPFAYNVFYTTRELHNLIPKMKTLYRQGAITGTNPSVLEEDGLFVQKFKGLSLMDIENMEVDPKTHELASEDIRRINRMFRTSGIFRIGREKAQTYALEHLIYFASQQWIHPEIGVPRSIKKLQENITAYFDYYTSFLTDLKRDPIHESVMLYMFALGSPYLPAAVSTYLPARLNITPSSAIKLYKQRELLSDFPSKLTWKKFGNVFFRSFNQAYRNNAFPEDLEQYQHYSEEIDSAATDKLLPYMQETATVQQQLQNKDEAENLLKQLDRHKKDVIREVMQNPKKRIEYQISKDYPAEKVTMIKIRDTFVFVMHFPDNVHVTLELDKTGKLFGVPPSLLKGYPHVGNTFITDLLTPLLEKYKAKDASDVQQSAVRQISTIPLVPTIKTKPEIQEQLTLKDQELKPPKRKRFMPAVTIFELDPLPPLTPQAPKVERFVAYSVGEVEELLGPRVSRQQARVDKVLRTVRNFEHGHIHGNLLTDSGPIVRLRAGDYRIFMERKGGGNYSITGIVNRKDAPY